MRKLNIYILSAGICLGIFSCQSDFIDLEPTGQYTDAVYFQRPSDFEAFTAGFYGYQNSNNQTVTMLPQWDFNNMDNNSDLSANANGAGYSMGHGTIALGSTNWDYSGIRNCNILLSKAESYTGEGDISQYLGEAYFFRAFAYFGLLKDFGGVPIITKVLEVDSPELFGARSSRYEVIDQILSDLDEAISRLPIEQNIASSDKGRVGKWAAKALKAQVTLYEATWEKYVGQGTDGDGTGVGAGTAKPDAYPSTDQMLAECITLAKDVMDNGGFELWNKNADPIMENRSSWFLFNLEDASSNPGGYDKSTNKEFILYSVYDFTYRQSRKNISWASYQLFPSRKFVDMPVCIDGLPPEKSPLFQGYHGAGDEFQNRDLRLLNYLYGSGTAPSGIPTLDYGGLGVSGYGNNKYAVFGHGDRRPDNTESANLPIIRLAEVYLMYAEALYELNGAISDDELDASINKLRDRAGVAHLTNALASDNALDMKEEIRRERAVELYREGKRFDDLKRWGVLEESLNPSRLGRVVGSASYPTDYIDADGNPTGAYKPDTYAFGEETVETPDGLLNCVVIDSKNTHTVESKHYLLPIPLSQIILNDKLLQNPGY